MTVEELRGLMDTLQNIDHLGRLKQSLLTARERRDRDAVVSEVVDSIRGNAPPSTATDVDPNAPGRRRRRAVQNLFAAMANPDTLLRELDGWRDLGPAYRHIKGEIDQAISERWLPMQAEAGQALDQLFSVYGRREMRRMSRPRRIPGSQRRISKWGAISLALNQGNVGNRQAVRESRQFTDREIEAVLGMLDRRDWDFVQSVWDHIDSYWPQIEEAQRRRTGVAPAKVAAEPVQTRFGVYRGGYFPLVYDRYQSIMAKEDDVNDQAGRLLSGRHLKAQTRRGHTIERTDSGRRPVMLDISVVHRHVNQVVYDLAVGDAVTYASNVLKSQRVRRAFEETDNVETWNTLEIWLQDTAAGETVAADAFSRAARWIRTGFTVSVLGWNVQTALIQPTGYLQTMAQLGQRYAYHGARALFTRPWVGPRSVFAEVQRQSEFMRHRTQTFSRDIWDTARDAKGGVVPDWVVRSGFYMMIQTQKVVDTATWLGAYRKGLDQFNGNEEQARLLADRMVARAQASGIFSDRSAIERGSLSRGTRQSEGVRMLTALTSYMIAKGNVAYERTRRADLRDPVEFVKWTADMMLLFTAEFLLIAAMRGSWPDEEDDETFAEFALRGTANSILSTIPVVRDFASEAEGFRGGGPYSALLDAFGSSLDQVGQGEIDSAMVESLNRLGGILFHYPSAQTNRAIDALWRDAEGEDVLPIEYLVRVERNE